MSLTRVIDVFAHFCFHLGDVLILPEIYSAFITIGKSSTRLLTMQELKVINQIYGDNLNLCHVLVDPKAKWVTRNNHIAYVSCHTINYWQHISMAVFVHECMHILQFQRLGSVYIFEALKAQNSKEGYDYGGPEFLQQSMLMGRNLADFNFEQQAEIVEDAYRHLVHSKHIPVQYQYFLNHVDEYGR